MLMIIMNVAAIVLGISISTAALYVMLQSHFGVPKLSFGELFVEALSLVGFCAVAVMICAGIFVIVA